MKTTPATLEITRVFNAPRQLVWNAFTEAKHLAHWWGPAGCTLEVKKLDLRAGGVFHYRMAFPDGNEMYGIFHYKEIKAPEKIVFMSSFSNAQGDVTEAPFPGNFPMEVHNTWIFTEDNGKTTITLHGTPVNASETEMDFFRGMHENMKQGYGGTLEKLDTYLRNLK